jgi:hypothetical protein
VQRVQQQNSHLKDCKAGIDEELLMNLNDSGYTFDEIADYIDGVGI